MFLSSLLSTHALAAEMVNEAKPSEYQSTQRLAQSDTHDTTTRSSQQRFRETCESTAAASSTSESIESLPNTLTVAKFVFVDCSVISPQELLDETKIQPTGEFCEARSLNQFNQDSSEDCRQFTLTQLVELTNQVKELYRQRGYSTSGAVIPTERLSKNAAGDYVVIIQVIEGTLEALDVHIQQPLDQESEKKGRLNNYVRSRLKVKKNEVLNIERLQEALQLLQLDPLLASVTATLSDGSEPGKSILVVEYIETNPFNPAVRLDNSRPPSIGSFQREVVLRHDNLTTLGDSLSVDYANTDGSDRIEARYEVPVNANNGTLRFIYQQSNSEVIEPPFDVLDIESDSQFYEVTFRQPVIREIRVNEETNERIFQELALGLTSFWRETESSLLGIPFPLSPGAENDGSTRIFALRFSQDWTLQNSAEIFAVRSQFSVGFNALNSTVNDPFLGIDIPDSEFFAWRAQGQWVRLFAPDTLLLLRADLQLANALLASEQFSIGGFGSVRGYRQDLLLTDNGFFASVEARLPILRTAQDSVFQLIPFIDVGTGWNSGSGRPDPDPGTLASVGIGLQFRQGDHLTARIDYGIPLIDVDSRDRTWQENGILFSIEWTPF